MTSNHRRDFLRHCSQLALGLAVAGKQPLFAANGPAPLTLLFFGGDLPAVRKELAKTYQLKALRAGAVPKKKGGDNVSGLEQLGRAHLWVGSAHKRTFPSKEQLGFFQAFRRAGKPIVGYRAASHVFQNWLEVDRTVFGARYGGHHLLGKEKELTIQVAKGAEAHPILKGLTIPPPRSGSYRYTELADDVTVLLRSGREGDFQPHTWVRSDARTGGRVFYTRYDAREIGSDAAVRVIFLRGIAWALNRLPKSS